MAVNGIEPTINLKLAQAYGARPLQLRPISAVPQVRPREVENGLSLQAATLLVRQQIDTFARTTIAPRVLRVVGARVPDPIDFTANVPQQVGHTERARGVGNALPMYRHPADRNDAATRINLGRLIDFDA